MRSPRLHGIVLLSLSLLVGAGLTGVAGAGNDAAPARTGSGSTPATGSQAMLTAAGKGIVIPPRIEEVEHMCAMLVGCGNIPIQVPTYDLGLCVRHFWERLSSPDAIESSLTIRECGLGAVSCDQFARCALRGADPGNCAGRGLGAATPVGRCDISGRALQCLEGKIVGVRDCPRGGELCAVRQGEADCVAGRCTVEPGKKSKPTCSDDKTRITTCKNGRVVSLSCAALGLECQVVDGQPKCVPGAAPSCTGAAERCDRFAAVRCIGGHEVRVECNQANLVCGVGSEGDSRVGACATSPYGGDDECDPDKYATRCRGTVVQYCAGGRVRKYDCKKSFGLHRCEGGPGQAHCAK